MKPFKEVKNNIMSILQTKINSCNEILQLNPNSKCLLEYGRYCAYLENIDKFLVILIGKMSEDLIKYLGFYYSMYFNQFYNDYKEFLNEHIFSNLDIRAFEICSILGLDYNDLLIFYPNPNSNQTINNFRLLLNNQYGLSLPTKEEEILIKNIILINLPLEERNYYEKRNKEIEISLGYILEDYNLLLKYLKEGQYVYKKN